MATNVPIQASLRQPSSMHPIFTFHCMRYLCNSKAASSAQTAASSAVDEKANYGAIGYDLISLPGL